MKNKKSIIAVVAVCILGIVGTTIAYYTANKTFENVFRTSDYSVSVTEEFESPNDWTPGTTTDKTIIATNTGNVDAAVRVSYVESWEDADGNPLPLVDNQSPAERYSVINYANTLKWIESTEDGKEYYYYKAKLAPGQTTASFIESVTYNELANVDVDEDCEDESTCTLTLDGHSGGKYKLTITVETAQYDKYKEIWGTEVEIAEEMPPLYTIVSGDLDTVGSEVCIDNECFYVVGQEDDDHVKLFAKYNLGVGNNVNPVNNIQDATANGSISNDYLEHKGGVVFSTSRPWADQDLTYPAYVYTNEKENGVYLLSIAEYVDNYVNILNRKGVDVTGRLISRQEICDIVNDGNNVSNGSDFNNYASNYAGKEWLGNSTFWLGSASNQYSIGAVNHNYIGPYFQERAIDIQTLFGVRPVIILEK